MDMDRALRYFSPDALIAPATEYGIRVLGAAVILFVGRWAARKAAAILKSALTRTRADATLAGFAANVAYFAFLAFVFIAALEQLGVRTASFAAAVAAAGLAIGLALQGSLSNFAAGVIIVLFRPFRIGDTIEGGGVQGTVHDISVFATTLHSPDKKTIIVPNAKLTAGEIVNYSVAGERRVDFVFVIDYADDIDQAKSVVRAVLSGDARVLHDRDVFVGITEIDGGKVSLAVQAWAKTENYGGVFHHNMEAVKKAFEKEGIGGPRPQDVRIVERKPA
jgi:small conductance mechanosensitive channel